MGAKRLVRIGALVLAAGFSNRFGSFKLAEPLADGRNIFQHTLSNIAQSLTEIVVISRPEVAPLLQTCLALPTLSVTPELIVFNNAKSGMGATLAFGVQQIPDWDGCLICLADMPFITPSSYGRIAAELQPDTIVIPQYQHKPGNPVGFGRDFYPALRQLQGDSGGRHIIASHPQRVTKLDLEDPALLMDIDTPKDLQRYKPA